MVVLYQIDLKTKVIECIEHYDEDYNAFECARIWRKFWENHNVQIGRTLLLTNVIGDEKFASLEEMDKTFRYEFVSVGGGV